MLLQFRKTADHERILEVGRNHVLKQVHVICAKLSQALVHQAPKITVTFATVVLHRHKSETKNVVKRQK